MPKPVIINGKSRGERRRNAKGLRSSAVTIRRIAKGDHRMLLEASQREAEADLEDHVLIEAAVKAGLAKADLMEIASEDVIRLDDLLAYTKAAILEYTK